MCFYEYPLLIPREPNEFIDNEVSFIASVLNGVNKRRRNLFYYRDPLNIDGVFMTPSLPLLFTASFEAFGLNYAESTSLISFFNSLSTTVFLYSYASYFSSHPFLSSACFIFNSGPSFFRILFGKKCQNNDYLRNVCFRTQVPWYSTFGSLMIFSKEFSFTLPLSIIAVLFSHFPKKKNLERQYYLIAGLASMLIPSVGSSTCVFLLCSCFANSFKFVMPFVLFLFPKFYKLSFWNFPIWREYQMYGVFYACLVVWFDQFGLMLFSFFFPISALEDNSSLHRFMAYLATFLLINLNRFGNTYFENVAAIMSVILPMICIYFVDDLFFISRLSKNKLSSGILSAICIFIFVAFITSGIVTIFNISFNLAYFMRKDDIECGVWINRNLNHLEVVTADSMIHNPASLIAGLQVLCGDVKSVWNSGSKITKSLDLIKRIENNKNPFYVMKEIGSSYLLTINNSFFNKWATVNNSHFASVFENYKWQVLKIRNE